MSEHESNVCARCGGMKRVDWTISFEECRPVEMHFDPASLASNWRLCPGHPEPATKHDGKLDERGDRLVRLMGDDGGEFKGNRDVVIMSGRHDKGIVLHPAQALSLLVWLTQEKSELERLAKEQGSEQ